MMLKIWPSRIEMAVVIATAFFIGMTCTSALAQGVSSRAFTTWVTGPNLLGGLVGLFIALMGAVLMAGRHTWEGVLFIVVGALVIGNAATIGAMLGGG